MADLFLSAGVPNGDRAASFPAADPYLITFAIRELFVAAVRDYRIVWGGHPAVTPMIWAICQDLGVDYTKQVVLYQSNFFEDRFPEENTKFKNRVMIPAASGGLELSLLAMRTEIFSRHKFEHGIFVGGMEGIHAEHELMRRLCPTAILTPIGAPGGAARQLVDSRSETEQDRLMTYDFGHLFRELVGKTSPSRRHQ